MWKLCTSQYNYFFNKTNLMQNIISLSVYTGCPRRNVKYFGRVFLMLNYTDITKKTYIQSWTVTEIMAREKCGHLAFPRSIRLQLCRGPHLPVVIWLLAELTLASFTANETRPKRQESISLMPICTVLGNHKDTEIWVRVVFVVQFNGFMSLTSYFDVMYRY